MTSPSLCIVIVDYIRDELEMYVEGLGAHGLSVVPIEAKTVDQAAAAIEHTPCAAVVTRIMPERFGIDLIRRLRVNPATARLPVVVISSLPVPSVHEEAREAGAAEVLLLPQTPDSVADAVKRAIRRAAGA